MQIRPEQLDAQLARGLGPLYTVHGDEALLTQEAGDAIRAAGACRGLSANARSSPSAVPISTGAPCSAPRRR